MKRRVAKSRVFHLSFVLRFIGKPSGRLPR
jgi:hypothetical protein